MLNEYSVVFPAVSVSVIRCAALSYVYVTLLPLSDSMLLTKTSE